MGDLLSRLRCAAWASRAGEAYQREQSAES